MWIVMFIILISIMFYKDFDNWKVTVLGWITVVTIIISGILGVFT